MIACLFRPDITHFTPKLISVCCLCSCHLMSFWLQNFFQNSSSRAIRSRFGNAIKTKSLSTEFQRVSITNTTTHATRVRVAIMKVKIFYNTAALSLIRESFVLAHFHSFNVYNFVAVTFSFMVRSLITTFAPISIE